MKEAIWKAYLRHNHNITHWKRPHLGDIRRKLNGGQGSRWRQGGRNRWSTGTFRAVKPLCTTCDDSYMSLYMCPKPQDGHHQEWPWHEPRALATNTTMLAHHLQRTYHTNVRHCVCEWGGRRGARKINCPKSCSPRHGPLPLTVSHLHQFWIIFKRSLEILSNTYMTIYTSRKQRSTQH